MNKIKSIIKEIDNIKPIPQVVHKVMAVVDDPLSSASDLADIIQCDSALTANLLKMCNSPFFGLSKKVDSIHQAVAYLGMNQVVEMALLDLGSDNLKQAQSGYDLRAGELWKHAVVSAFVAKDIANAKNLKDKHLVFTASLLKDIGKTILSEHVKNYFDHIERLIAERDISFREGEKEIIGIDHAELGALITEKWNFSHKMVNIIRNHHLDTGWDEDDMEIAAVYVADTLSMITGIGGGSDGLAYRFHPRVMKKLHFTDTDIQLMMVSLGEKLHQVESLVGTV
jgi:putative nucleotidyltransferase with HDIG domain